SDARAYCAYMGKVLPSSEQWEKALRGGLTLADGARNPYPARNLPWGAPRTGTLAKLNDAPRVGPAAVGTFSDDVSPDGVLDLAGNVSEWTLSVPSDGEQAFRVLRGGNWYETSHADLVDFMAIENPRPVNATVYSIGLRCATPPESRPSSSR
ncbi:MAG TPA: SUMF1/EgtB/PvdO family nonheme iron enzyme, partial [Kofleriaceae bacterium]|nr:SUMF1/EgtB/PvdO family nonheme iron enzyme [Kofleriaceae bacterium]